jgi:hypothetical protein
MPVFSRLAVAVQLFAVFLSPVLGAAATQQYDYVIVGGGVTGLIVANRLTEDKNSKYYAVTTSLKEHLVNIPFQRAFSSLRVVTMSTETQPRSRTRPMI